MRRKLRMYDLPRDRDVVIEIPEWNRNYVSGSRVPG